MSPKRCVLENKQDGVQIKTRRWIMSRNIIFVLMHHRPKPLDLIYINHPWGYLMQYCETVSDARSSKGADVSM
jgi:hypothetical protein